MGRGTLDSLLHYGPPARRTFSISQRQKYSAVFKGKADSNATPPGGAGLTAKNGLDGHGRHHAEAKLRAAALPRFGPVLKDGELP